MKKIILSFALIFLLTLTLTLAILMFVNDRSSGNNNQITDRVSAANAVLQELAVNIQTVIEQPEITASETPSTDYVTIGGQQYSTSLTELHLQSQHLEDEDIVHLRYMTNLTQLSLVNNEISDLTPLSGLHNLTDLFLNSNPISNWSPISHMEYVYGGPRQE